jgi:prepilin peptidase CpaA
LLGALLGTAFYTDHRKGKIPNVLSAGGLLAGVLLQYGMHGPEALLESVIGMAAGFFPLLLLYLFGALGAGDVKLFAAIGSIMGSAYVLDCMMYSILFAGIIGLFILAAKKILFRRLYPIFVRLVLFLRFKDPRQLLELHSQEMLRFPFMYAVLPAFALTVLITFGWKGE